VMETVGSFDGTVARGSWSVIPGSGSEALAGITGEGRFEAPHGPKASYSIDLALAAPWPPRG